MVVCVCTSPDKEGKKNRIKTKKRREGRKGQKTEKKITEEISPEFTFIKTSSVMAASFDYQCHMIAKKKGVTMMS